jgi:nucleoside-diphosphate-sugar epimerase
VPFNGSTLDLTSCEAAANVDVIVHGIPETSDATGAIEHATRGTWNLLTTTRATRYVQLSSMRMFDAYGLGWQIDESWAPRPTPGHRQLAPYLAEVASREITRSRQIECFVLRLDDVVAAEVFERGHEEPESLHIDDAVSAIVAAVNATARTASGDRWSVFNIARGGPGSRYPVGRARPDPLLWKAANQASTSVEAHPSKPVWPIEPSPVIGLPRPARIAILGAGGPLGAATARVLERDHVLRLSDHRPLAEIATLPPQSEGAPLPEAPNAPHEEVRVDVTHGGAVRHIAQNMDAIVNCTVIRNDPVEAFRVNTLGALNVMQAAVEAGIRRVVHTGPVLTLAPHPAGYNDDRAVESTAPPRPGDSLYFVSKLLGQEICRVFAEHHEIACPTLLFSGFVDPETARRRGDIPGPFTISWNDAGRAIAAAVTLEHLPEPFPVMHILADAPHDRFTNSAARSILGWTPLDRLDDLWWRQPE